MLFTLGKMIITSAKVHLVTGCLVNLLSTHRLFSEIHTILHIFHHTHIYLKIRQLGIVIYLRSCLHSLIPGTILGGHMNKGIEHEL